jgi:hypothetical protein
MDMATKADVVQYCHPPKHLHLLKGPGNAKFGPLTRLKFVNVLPLKIDIALLRTVEPVYAIHHDRLAGTVRPDNGMDLPFSDFQADTDQGADPSEIHMDVIQFQQDITFGKLV